MAAKLARVLRERLGEESSDALVSFVDETARECKGDVMDAVTERFGRMLAEECGKVRIEIAERTARLDARLTEQAARLDARLAEHASRMDARMTEHASRMDARFTEQAAGLDVRLAGQRAELLKWSFLFWLGQVAAMAALLAFMLRGVPR